MRRWARWACAGLAALLAGLATLAWPGPARADAESPPTVVLLTAGLTWADLDAATMPRALGLAARATTATLTHHVPAPRTCPLDGFATLSAGVEIAPAAGGPCPHLPSDSSALRQAWRGWARHVGEEGSPSRLGALGDVLSRAGERRIALGAGAGLALASSSGEAPPWQPLAAPNALAAQVRRACASADVVVADLGWAHSPATRREVRARLEAALAGVAPHATLLLADVADSGTTPQLGIYLQAGGNSRGTWAYSEGTRRAGFVRLVDVTATLLATRNLPTPEAMSGTALTATAAPASASSDTLVALTRRAADTHAAARPFYIAFGLATTAVIAVAAARVTRGWREVTSRRARLGLTVGGLVTLLIGPASWPVSRLLLGHVGVTPVGWAGVLAAVAATACALAGCCLGVNALAARWWRPWRRHWADTGPVLLALAVVLAWVLGSVIAGSPDQLDTLFGSPATTATRFFGLNNAKYALGLAALLALLALTMPTCDPTTARKSHLPLWSGLALGAVFTLLDGAPAWGADVGGPLGVTLGVGTLLWLLHGRRLGLLPVAGFAALGVAISAAFALLDASATPASQSHSGRFVAAVWQGTAAPIITRKLDAMASTFADSDLGWALWAGVAGVACLAAWWRWRARQSQKRAARPRSATPPRLRALLTASTLSLVCASLTNDSGAIILACGGSVIAAAILVWSARYRRRAQ